MSASMTMTWPSDAHDRSWLSTAVSWVTVKTKTRSKNSSSVETRCTGAGAVTSTVPVTAGEPSEPAGRARRGYSARRAETQDPLMAHGHGRRARARGAGDPGSRPLPEAPARARPALPRSHQQLDLHPPRSVGAPARQRPGGARGLDLHLGAGHRGLPPGPAPGRLGLRHRRGRADHRDA